MVHNVKEKVTKCCQQFSAMLTKIDMEKYLRVNERFDCVSCFSKDNPKETLHLAADGCFKLRREKRKHLIETEPRINNFFINRESEKLLEKLDKSMAKNNDESCEANFKAAKATPKNNKFDEKGVVGLFCARHGTPLLFMDIFTGERYAYIDMLLLEYLKNKLNVKNVIFYYDVGCKYIAHFKQPKMQSLCKEKGLDRINFKFVVPAMHVKAHQFPCPWRYNPKYITNNGNTDGETSERAWAYLGRFASITKSMSPSNRRDTLEMAIFNYFMRNLKNQEKNMIRKLERLRVEFSKKKCESFKHLINKEENNNLGEYRRELIADVDRLIENQINSNSEIQSREEQLNRLIKKEYQQMISLNIELPRREGQLNRAYIYHQISLCRSRIESYMNERKTYRDPPSEQDITNPNSKFWADFSFANQAFKKTIDNWEVLQSFDRLKEEEMMLVKELEIFKRRPSVMNDTGTDLDDCSDTDLNDYSDDKADCQENQRNLKLTSLWESINDLDDGETSHCSDLDHLLSESGRIDCDN